MKTSEIIKEVWKDRRPEFKKDHIILRSMYYGSRFGHINKFIEEAKKDFPGIDVDSIEIVQYGGRHYKGTFGVEFTIAPDSHPLEGYREVPTTEYKIN